MLFPKKMDQLLFCDQHLFGRNVIFHVHKVVGSVMHMFAFAFDDGNLEEGTAELRIPLPGFGGR